MSMNSRCCIQELLFVYCFNTTPEFNHYLPQTVHVLLFKFIYLCIILEILFPPSGLLEDFSPVQADGYDFCESPNCILHISII